MNICVFGAASTKIDKSYIEKVEEFGYLSALRGNGLVFGAGANGLMGAAARGAFKGKGKIIGIAPKFFNVDGILFENCDELIKTETMRERKQIMDDMSDAVVITPGGIGTYDEFYEILTLKQLERHNKPIVVFNINGYYNKMLEMINFTVEENFMSEKSLKLFKVLDDSKKILDYLEQYQEEALKVEELKFIK